MTEQVSISMLEKLKNFINRNPFLKNVVVLVSGNALAYCVQLVSLPVISRVYAPGELGEYDLILSSGRFVMDLISLGLLIAIMLPKEDKKARQLCQFILGLNIFFLTILFSLFCGIRGSYKLFDVSIPYVLALFLLCLYLFFNNMQLLYYSYTNRIKEYKALFWSPLLISITNVGISILLGVLGFGVTGYMIGTITSCAICCLYLQMHAKPFKEKIDISAWKQILIQYKEIPLVQLPADIISQVGNEIPTQYLGRVFGSAMLGGYSMAVRILLVSVSLLSFPINRVVCQTMAEKRNNGEPVGDFLFELLDKSIKTAIFPVGFLIIFGEKIIPFILGASWVSAGQYVVILGAMYLLKFCSACVSGTFVIMGRQRLSLIMSFINLAKFGICFGISYFLGMDVVATILLYTIVEGVYQLLNLILCVYCTNYSISKFMIFIIKYVIGGNAVIYLVYFIFNRFVNC